MRKSQSACLVAGLFWLVALARPATAETPLERCFAEASNRLELKPCLEARLADAKRRLSSAEAAMREEMDALHAITGRDAAVRAFAEASIAFERFRDRDCRWTRERAEPGTGAADFELDCLIRHTESRAHELRAELRPADAND